MLFLSFLHRNMPKNTISEVLNFLKNQNFHFSTMWFMAKILRFVVYISFIYVVALIPYHIFTCFSRKVNLCGIDLVNVYNANATLSFKCFRKNLLEKRLPYILHFHLKQSSKKYKNLFLSTLRGESFVELLIFTLFTKKCTISY